jgi:hypothetical protein
MVRVSAKNRKNASLGLVLALLLSSFGPSLGSWNTSHLAHASLTAPTVTAVTPSSGTAAGGNTVTISGQGFFDGNGDPAVTKVMFGPYQIPTANFTVISDVSISATIPARSGVNKTIGANKVVVFRSEAVSSSDSVFYYFAPTRDESQDVNALVTLGELASRTQMKPVFRTASSPFLVYGIDSLTRQPYRYETNFDYSDPQNHPAWNREGGEPGFTKRASGVDGDGSDLVTTAPPRPRTGISISSLASGDLYTFTDDDDVETTYTMRRDATLLKSRANCRQNPADDENKWINTFQPAPGEPPITAYCSVFGPEIYSEVFFGKAGQSLAFDWLAIGETDDYEVYGYLVAVSDEVSIPKTDVASHTLVAHGIGYRLNPGSWRTDVADIPADGLYRFRFVNGSYDGTGGYAVGSTFAISSVFDAGLRNEITLGPISDQIGLTGTFVSTATALSGGRVEVTSRTPSICSVVTSYAAPTTSLTITKLSAGTCELVGTRALDGEYAPAADVLVAFDIRDSVGTSSPPVITSVNPGNQTLTVDIVAPSRDGGSSITSYEYSTDGGTTWASVSPASAATRFTITSLSSDGSTALTNGVTYSIRVRALTSIGPSSGSNPVDGVPNVPAVPSISYDPTTVTRPFGVVTQFLAPSNTGGPIASYSLTGALPTGLNLNTSTGIIFGSPSQVGTFTIEISATNTSGTSAPATLVIVVLPSAATAPLITQVISGDGTLGVRFDAPSRDGGTAISSYEYSTDGGGTWASSSPASAVTSITISSISSNASTALTNGVTYSIRVRALTDAGPGLSSNLVDGTPSAPALPSISYTIATVTLSAGAISEIAAPTNTGGPIRVYLLSGTLPTGLTLDTASGVISGTPTQVGTFSVDFSAANSTGTSAAVTLVIVVLSVTAAKVDFSPEITLISPNVVTTAGGELIRVEGRRLGQGNSVTLAGVRVQLLSSTPTGFTFLMPALPVQVLDKLYTYNGGARLTYMNAITVVPAVAAPVAPVNPETASPITPRPTPTPAAKPWSAIGVASKFAPGSAVINRAVRSEVNLMLRKHARFATSIQCTGFTMGPTVLRVDAKLSRDRAANVCRLIKQLRPKLNVISTKGQQELGLGGEIRRVEVRFSR